MHPVKLIKVSLAGFGLALLVTGCAPAGGDGGTGGSKSGSGGASSGSGGSSTGSGGASSSGGSNGSGGASSGGAPGSGGASSGGAPGSGGASSGGAPGSGGASSSGGAPGSGGRGGAGTGTGGAATGTGGAGTATGGAGSGTGGAAGGSSGGGTFTLTSPTHMDGAKFDMKFTCAAMNGTFGSGVNPELNWTGVPANTKSFVMTFIDTKLGEASAMGQHWAMWDIPATVTKLPEGTTTISGTLAGAKQTNKYLSPCPSGNDTYAFTIYALSAANLTVTGAEGTGVANSAGVAKVLAALKMVTPLGNAKLTGTSGPMGK